MPRANFVASGLCDTWGRANRKLRNRNCPACGAEFRPLRATSKFCSRPCARTINGGQNYKGESWWVDQKGYIAGRVWVDGKSKPVKRHRWVMEQHLGRPLMAFEDVHHIDGDKQNNSVENLMVLPHSEHTRLTNRARAAIAKAEGGAA